MKRAKLSSVVGVLACFACGQGADTMATSGVTVGEGDGDGDGDGDGEGDDGEGPVLDVSTSDLPEGEGSCKVVDQEGGDGVGDCDAQAPADAFAPAVQWEWWPEDEIFTIVTPMVANLTDDDQNGAIDLCDTPDVVVVATAKLTQPPEPGHLWILDGATGQPHHRIETPVKEAGTVAIADLDDDGVPEIITSVFDFDGTPGHLIAFEPDGTIAWEGDTYSAPIHGSAPAIADVDNDGDPEIAYHDMLFDHEGHLLVDLNRPLIVADVPVLIDLDGDSDMEIVLGNSAYHHTGQVAWSTNLSPGFAAIADFDGDALPEVLLTNESGINMLEHDGQIVYAGLRPTGVEADGLNWARPATVHNLDDDPEPEYALSSRDWYTVYDADGSIVWSTTVLDDSGFATGTAFDFLGDGSAEAMYADESTFFVFDDAGEVLLSTQRDSHTLHEYPVVVDVDDDGSAEILVGTEERAALANGGPTLPTMQAIRDQDDRWIQARRIWNQHTYHVTNVREDATIPTIESPHWLGLNTFRTNAQLDASGAVCVPPPQG